MKIKLYQIISFLVIILILAGIVFALPVNKGINKAEASDLKNTIALPTDAIEVSSGVFYLGKAFDKGRIVEGYAFVRYKEGYGKPTGCNNDGKCQGWEDASCGDCSGGGGGEDPTTDTSSCYGFLAKGAKWKTVEDYIVDSINNDELSGDFVSENFALDVGKWEDAANFDILGNETSGDVDGADTLYPDDKNEVYFGNIVEPGAIAITIVWGYFGGPPQWRELVEWDMVFDDVDFNWSSTGEANKMDFENIATHELGHSVGLDDLYDSKCSEMTMYGYASDGEIKKRDLEDGDITGIKKLYG